MAYEEIITSSKAAAANGTALSLVTTGEKSTWNNKAGTAVATTDANGLMSSDDKTKLDKIFNYVYSWFSSGNTTLKSGMILVVGNQIHIDCVLTCKHSMSPYWDLLKLPFAIKSPAGPGNRYIDTQGFYIDDNGTQILSSKSFNTGDDVTLKFIFTKYGITVS